MTALSKETPMNKLTAAALALAVLCGYRPVPALAMTLGHLSVALDGQEIVCRFRDTAFFVIEPIAVGDAQPRGVGWSSAETSARLEGRAWSFAARGDGVEAALRVELNGKSVGLLWNGRVARPCRLVVSIPDQTYRKGEGFRFDARYSDGRQIEDEIYFDVLQKTETRRDLATLRLHAPRTGVTLRAVVPAGGWDFVDARRSGGGRKANRLAFSMPIDAAASDGKQWQRELRIEFDHGDHFTPLDLRAVVNRGLEDEQADDGKGGWTDQGNNDLRGFPTGVSHYLGVPFDVIDPAQNADRSAIVLRGAERIGLPERVEVLVGEAFTTLHVLHTAAWTRAGNHVADYVLAYADGTASRIAIFGGRDVLDWWGTGHIGARERWQGKAPACRVAWVGRNGAGDHIVRVLALSIANPHPEKVVRSIAFESKGTGVACILAATLSDGSYLARGPAVVPLGRHLPLSPLAIRCDTERARNELFDVILKAGAPLAIETGLADLCDEVELVVLTEPPSEDDARQVVDYVRRGGNVYLAGVPSDVGPAELLPFDPTRAEVAQAPAKWARLVPADRDHPAFSGLAWDRNVLDYPIPPATEYMAVGPLKDGTEVLATWGAHGPPALLSRPLGEGRVTCLTSRHYRLDDTKRPMSGFIDYFDLKLCYWAAGLAPDAGQIGRMAEARIERNRIGRPYADCRALIEDVSAKVQFIGDAELDRAVEGIAASLSSLDGRIDALDDALLGFDFAPDPRAGYRQVIEEIEALTARLGRIAGQADERVAARSDLHPRAPAGGPPLPTGIFVTLPLVGPGSIGGEYRLDAYLEHIKELDFDVTMLYLTNGREIRGGRLDPHMLWKPKEGGGIEWLTHLDRYAWLREVLTRHGHRFIPMYSYARPRMEAEKYWPEFVEMATKYFAPWHNVIVIEPENEGVIHRPWTDDDFRAFLRERYQALENLNARMGSSYGTFDEIGQPTMISLGGKKQAPEEAMKAPYGAAARAMYYEHSLFRMNWLEEAMKSTYLTVKAITDKPVNDRNTPVWPSVNPVPCRMEHLARWHDSLGTHAHTRFQIDRSRAYAQPKPLRLTEFYWHSLGRTAGMHYRLHGSFMLPVAEMERQNVAAVTRTFWGAVSRGTELFAIFSAIPVPGSGYWENRADYGPSCIVWPDHSPKRPIYAFRSQRRVFERFSAEVFGSHTDFKVAVVEPIASRIHENGSVIEKATGTVYNEMSRLWGILHQELRIPNDPQPPMYDLSDYPYLVLPSGLCLAKRSQTDLIGYVRAGATLIATLAPGMYDEHTKRDGRLLDLIGVAPIQRPLGDHRMQPGGKMMKLPRAVVYGYDTTPQFGGRILGRYDDGVPCWLEAPLGKGKVVLAGFSAMIGAEAMRDHVLAAAIERERLCDWTFEASGKVDCFVRRKGDARVFFIINRDFRESHAAMLRFDRTHEIIDLRGAIGASGRSVVDVPRLWPGECRILRVGP